MSYLRNFSDRFVFFILLIMSNVCMASSTVDNSEQLLVKGVINNFNLEQNIITINNKTFNIAIDLKITDHNEIYFGRRALEKNQLIEFQTQDFHQEDGTTVTKVILVKILSNLKKNQQH